MSFPGRTTAPHDRLEALDEWRPERPDEPRPSLAWKHALDRVGAAWLILVCAPLMLVCAIALKATSRGSVLLRRRRVARDGSSFDMLAFRPLPGLPGLPFDQLPQLFNVLRGDMSFVGPRPERPQFVELFGENLRRHDQPRVVKPGILGWAQLRELQGHAPLAERERWDERYVESWSLGLDLKIVLMTLRDAWFGRR